MTSGNGIGQRMSRKCRLLEMLLIFKKILKLKRIWQQNEYSKEKTGSQLPLMKEWKANPLFKA